MSNLNTITLYIDTKEKTNYPFLVLSTSGIKVINQSLEIGDYILTNGEKTVYVELKIENDLISSMYDKRLSKQLTKLSAKEFSILAFVGNMYDNKMLSHLPSSLQNEQTLVSIATSVALKKGDNRVGFVQYDNMSQFEMGLYYIARKLHNDLVKGNNEMMYDENLIGLGGSEKISYVSEEDRIKKVKISTIMRLPRIGYKTAVDILEHYDYDMKRILYDSDEKEFTSIRGIGKKTFEWIEKIYR